MSTHNDEPVLDCLLGRIEWRDNITRQIIRSKPPKAIAIHGTWGTGKTSLLAQIYAGLGGDHTFHGGGETNVVPAGISDEELQQVRPVWFEAWQYQHEENILAALLKEVRNQLAMPFKIWKQAESSVVAGALSVLQSIDLSIEQFGVKFGLKGFGKNFTDNLQAYDKERFATPLDSVMLKKMLKEAIDQLLGIEHIVRKGVFKRDSGKKVIIFIDDLDRCEPEVAFRMLESIKVYLNLENCIFVLGMDMRAVERSLAKHYEKQLGPKAESYRELKNLARLYLEKICQEVYHLPVLTDQVREAYFTKLLTGRIEDGDGAAGQLVRFAAEARLLPPFPRSIKILSNVIISHTNRDEIRAIVNGEEDELNRKVFLILCYLYAYHYELYELCYLYPDFYNDALLPYCENPKDFETEEGKHQVLDGLIIPDTNRPSVTEAFEGETEETLTKRQLQRMYPHESLRQVFWIRDFIVDTGPVAQNYLENLKL